jgi:DNA-directed RNA polymerase subunit alpha
MTTMTTNQPEVIQRAHELVHIGQLEKAVDLLEEAHAKSPDDDAITFQLACYQDLSGDDDRAIELYELLAEKQPTYANVLINLSVLYEDDGMYDEAEKCLHRLLQADPNHPMGRMYYQHVDGSIGMEVQEEPERRLAPRDLLLSTSVTDFELSARARNCLKKMNIRSLGDLLRTTEADLLSYKNFGETSLDEIKQMLTKKGLRLGQAADEAHEMQKQEILKQVADRVPPETFAKPVTELQLPLRAARALERLGIATVGDLAARTEAELLGVKNFGETSLDEVKSRLAELGLSLRTVD